MQGGKRGQAGAREKRCVRKSGCAVRFPRRIALYLRKFTVRLPDDDAVARSIGRAFDFGELTEARGGGIAVDQDADEAAFLAGKALCSLIRNVAELGGSRENAGGGGLGDAHVLSGAVQQDSGDG